MNKNTLILIIVLIAVAVIILVWSFSYYLRGPEIPVVAPLPAPSDAVEELTEGTIITNIEQDLEALLQEDELLGDLEVQIQQLEQQLEAEGL